MSITNLEVGDWVSIATPDGPEYNKGKYGTWSGLTDIFWFDKTKLYRINRITGRSSYILDIGEKLDNLSWSGVWLIFVKNKKTEFDDELKKVLNEI